MLTDLRLTVTSPTTGDLGFLKSVTIYIKADGLSEIEVASSGEVSGTIGKTLELTTTDYNLMEYIKKDSFTLKVTVVTDEVITEDHEIAVDANFFVDAKVLGV